MTGSTESVRREGGGGRRGPRQEEFNHCWRKKKKTRTKLLCEDVHPFLERKLQVDATWHLYFLFLLHPLSSLTPGDG